MTEEMAYQNWVQEGRRRGWLAKAVDACQAAIRYDDSIFGRAARGEVNLLESGAGIAEGKDLDALYDDWISKANAALAAYREETP